MKQLHGLRDRGSPTPPLGRRLARVAAVTALAVGLGCVGALHLLRPDLSPMSSRLSVYAVGAHSLLMAMAFVAMGISLGAVAAVVHAEGGAWRWRRTTAVLLGIASAGMVVSAVHPTEPSGLPSTVETVHSVASGVATFAIIVAAGLQSVPFRRSGAGRPLDAVGSVLGIVGVLLGVVSPLLHHSQWTGLSQRLLWLSLWGWLLWVALPGHDARSDLRGVG